MYVLADLEWVEDRSNRISLTQIAMVRVDENWKAEESIYRRIRPLDPSFHQWEHVAFTGGTREDFLSAPNRGTAFSEIFNWLWPDDIICWWFEESKAWLQKLAPDHKAKRFFLQCYRDTESVLLPGLHAPDSEKLHRFARLLRPFVDSVEIRGIE